jgi:hypothetical protein
VQNFDCSGNTGATGCAETIGISAPDHYCSSAQAQRFHNVAPPANPTIQEDINVIANSGHNFRQNPQRWRDAIKLATAMIGHDQRVRSHVHCATCVLWRVDTFNHD